jgi:hypothetical protein
MRMRERYLLMGWEKYGIVEKKQHLIVANDMRLSVIAVRPIALCTQ